MGPPRRAFLLAAGVVGLAPPVASRPVGAQPTPIDACTVIDEPGEYVLVRDLLAAADSSEPCLAITADDVALDGDGHAVGTESFEAPAIAVTGDDVTVEHAAVHGPDVAVTFSGAARGVVCDVDLAGSGFDGVVLARTRGMSVTGVAGRGLDGTVLVVRDSTAARLVGNDLEGENGVIVDGGAGNVISHNDCRRNENGIQLVDATGTVVSHNAVEESLGFGISVVRAGANVLVLNTVTDGGDGAGIRLERSTRNQVVWNAVRDGDGAGIHLLDADDNHLVLNEACGNDAGDLVVDGDSTGNRLVRNVTCD